MNMIDICSDPRAEAFESRSCCQCRHYGDDPDAPDCIILACMFANGEAPGIVLEPKRVKCEAWEPIRTQSEFASGQLTLTGEVDQVCPSCGRSSVNGEHKGCRERRERHEQLERLAAEWIRTGKRHRQIHG